MTKNKNYRLVFYEELCVKLHDEILDIVNHAGIEFEEQMKDFVSSFASLQNSQSEYFSILRNPVSSLSKWENKLSKEMTDKISSIVNHSEIGRLILNSYQNIREPI